MKSYTNNLQTTIKTKQRKLVNEVTIEMKGVVFAKRVYSSQSSQQGQKQRGVQNI